MKKVFLEISQNSQENTCFPMDFAKFLRTPFFTEYLWTTASLDSEAASQNISECLLPKPVRYQSKILKFFC